MKGSGKGISFCLVVLSVFSFVSLSQAQAEPTIAREMLSGSLRFMKGEMFIRALAI